MQKIIRILEVRLCTKAQLHKNMKNQINQHMKIAKNNKSKSNQLKIVEKIK
jgi:hypothetical protein